jgi:hypothetical protein
MGNRTFVQVPPDSTGDKLAMRTRTKGADQVLEQATYIGEEETYIATAPSVAPAANKSMLAIHNAAGSGVTVRIHDVHMYSTGMLAAVSGVNSLVEIRRTSGTPSAGTVVTPEKLDTNNSNLPGQVVVRQGATVTDGNLLFSQVVTNDEPPLTGLPVYALDMSVWKPLKNIKQQPYVLREGEGVHVKNITSTVIGSYTMVVVFSVEATNADV